MRESITYTNPVLPGFYPDPSVCRVGEDYYLVTSSFEYFPGIPLFHSRDLIHWQQIGHCLTRASQVPLAHIDSSTGIFAPTLRYHQGRFYMVTTNVTGGGNFFVWAQDPAGPWSEPIWLAQGGIDPSLCFDGEHVYLTSNGDGPEIGIYQCELDIQSGEQLTETRYIWPGTGGRYPEAPHLYHIGDYYYLLIAEGGTEYGHMATIARSHSPWGPFESCPYNPILTHRDQTMHEIQGTGHADLLQAHDGSWWLFFLAFRPHDRLYHHLGRETYLAPITWTEDGWPQVSASKTVELQMQAQALPLHCLPQESPRDDFDSEQLRFSWNHLRNPYPEDWSLSERPGWLRFYGSPLTLDSLDAPAFVGRRQQHFVCCVETLLDFSPSQEGHEAGLTVLANEQHHYEIAVLYKEGERWIIVRRRIGDLVAVVAQEPLAPGLVTLTIQATVSAYSFCYALAGQPARHLASASTRYLSTEVAGGFTGVYFGLYATSNHNGRTSPADFDWFTYHAER
ncbi:glycoside hydrolase family 43 protein [Dictyobacter arantiisoli]|uniref:Glycoside hydrolase 43 family protein n=1 Tax=Dictyobacter arantiisoli TaxID=2014874 RepID=A0A5A5T825_9CHLR|nr:glycoside hydrolase family 43 protein [Dictyobacter arantiisoli]GCF07552.1 glycoside hydrolase 43 family protein [Dictyobacter arantiisoli]